MSPTNEMKSSGRFVTQEDIDQALSSASPPEVIPPESDLEELILDESDIVIADVEAVSEDQDYFGLLSQEDVEALLRGDLQGSSTRQSQDEIDSLFKQAATPQVKTTGIQGKEGRKGKEAQEEVERLMREASELSAPKGDRPKSSVAQEADAAVSAISQDDIDRLLMGAIEGVADEAGQSAAPVSQSPETEAVISQDDINRLLMGAMDDAGDDGVSHASARPKKHLPLHPADDQGLDRGAEMGGEPRQKASPSPLSEHVSQDEINRLLKESLQEEDFQGDAFDSVDLSETPEPVILAADEESPGAESAALAGKLIRPDAVKAPGWYRQKMVLAGVAAGVVLLVTASLMMFSGSEAPLPGPPALTYPVPTADKTEPAPPPVNTKSIRFAGFVILAPSTSSAATYVAADLAVDLSDDEIAAKIKENEAFVRDIIYRAIRSELMSRDISTLKEDDLALVIRKALGRIIPRDVIDRVEFEKFLLV